MNRSDASVGVVIVSYNTSALLHDCLQSLQGCGLPLHIVVVDNASTDDSVAMVATHFPTVQLCPLRNNRGFAAANNVGLRQLGFCGDSTTRDAPAFALLLNPDTVVTQNAIETLVAFLAAHPRVGLVGPRLLNSDGSIQTAAFRFPTLSMSILDVFPPGEVLPGRLYDSWWHGRYPNERNGVQPFPIDHPLGACMLVRRGTLAEVGLLDEAYFMYSEEIEWCWRIRQAGWAIWQVPQAQVIHFGGAATSQFRQRMLVELHRSRVRFFRQHYDAAFAQLHRLVMQLGMLRASLQTWRSYAQKQIDTNELRARLWAYGEVRRL